MLRTVFCLNGPNAINGPNVWLTRHLPLLARRGVEPVVLYLSRDPDEPCRYRDGLAMAGITVVSVRQGAFVEENAEAIARAAGALSPSAFVPNYSVAGHYAAGFLKAAGVATVGTLHSDDPYYHDILDVFVAGSERWRLTGVVAVSEYLRALAAERMQGALQLLHAPYGAPVPAACATWTPERFRLVYSGRLVERQKRVRRVVSSMLAAASRCPRVEGVIYGDGPERPRLQQELAGHGDRVRLGGTLAPDAVQPAMLDGHAFVLLSDFEGLSIALMEAMACGLVPLVTPMRSGVSDLVEDEVTGLVVPEGDEAAFADTVSRLARDPARWRRLSEAARRRVVEHGFTGEACADKWAGFLARLTSCRSPTQPVTIPAWSAWDLPPRSGRPDGIRVEDRRSAWALLQVAVAAGRPVYLWGASRGGEHFLASMGDRRVRVEGFIDTDPAKAGGTLRAIPVHSPTHLEQVLAADRRPFVVITSQYEAEIAGEMTRMGMREVADFVAG